VLGAAAPTASFHHGVTVTFSVCDTYRHHVGGIGLLCCCSVA